MQFLDELDSPALLQPRLLQLRAVYAQDDDYLKDGYHLRWLPHPTFGFPRRGFLLSVREKPSFPWDSVGYSELTDNPNKLKKQGPRALWGPAKQGTSDSGHELGIRVSRTGNTIGSPGGSSVELPVKSGLSLEFLDSTGEANPAAWVAVRVNSGVGQGSVTATARAGGRPGQDTVTVAEVKNKNISELPEWITVSGGLIDSITITAPGGGELKVDKVRWIPANRYVDDNGWQALERFLLPYDGNSNDYPKLSRDVDARLEDQDLGLKSFPPWREGGRTELTTEIRERYIGTGGLSRLKGHLGKMLSSEKDVPQPQGEYKLGSSEGIEMRTGGRSGGDAALKGKEKGLEVPFVQFLLGASMGTPFAHLLGLAHFLDPNGGNSRLDPDSQYDFKISAVYPRRWWKKSLSNIFPSLGNGGSTVPPIPGPEDLPPDEATFPREIAEANSDFFRVVSLATNVGPDTPLTEEVLKPRDLTVNFQDTPGKEPIPVEAVLNWCLPRQEMKDLEDPVVGYMAERTDNEGTVLLDGRERNLDQPGDETDEEVRPRLIDLDENKHELRDAGLRVEGNTTWNVYLMDFWGRWSEAKSVPATVKDKSPPPPPSGLTAEFEGELDDPGSADDNPMVLEFKYGEDLVNQARDLSSFRIYLDAGDVESPSGDADYTIKGLHGDDGPNWQDAAVDQEGVSVTVIPPIEGSPNEEDDQPNEKRARRVRVEGITGPSAEDEENEYHWHTTAFVRAVDDSENKSKPATDVATFVESVVEKVPAPEVEKIEYTTWPDADDLGWWRCEWDPKAFEPGARIQVLRTSGARLLAEAGQDRDKVFSDSENRGEKADELRRLALDNREAFAPDHPESYDVQRGHHDVAIEASSRDLHLVLVMPTGPTGERSEWPTSKDKFAVIAARPLKPVPKPRLNARSEDVRVHLDLSVVQDVERVRVWRTTESGVDDLREMRPLPPIDLQARDSDGEDDDESSMRTGLSQVDENVEPSKWYAYRAVAEAKDGRRSEPTEPVWIQTDEPFSVEGKVKDAERNDSLPGVNVVVVDTNQGTTTDAEGRFDLDVASRDTKLRFAFTGYETKVVPLEGRSEITVELSPTT